jgi:hypothetical protein
VLEGGSCILLGCGGGECHQTCQCFTQLRPSLSTFGPAAHGHWPICTITRMAAPSAMVALASVLDALPSCLPDAAKQYGIAAVWHGWCHRCPPTAGTAVCSTLLSSCHGQADESVACNHGNRASTCLTWGQHEHMPMGCHAWLSNSRAPPFSLGIRGLLCGPDCNVGNSTLPGPA